ncbi:acyl-CoA carboxylase epsilon subunit, partial [Streptomyces sp. NPDC001833]|uniref:acyl-CoA carboxylase epsilon subunit n=1 Tax=Streptomyces sp. NPDC001833 TaxID=3154658 RepID=UPI00332B9654
MNAPESTDGAEGALVIRVVKGQASPAELAALTTVLLARAAALAAVDPYPLEPRPVAAWRRPERLATHREWPGGELADRLGVSRRTVRRDIDRLRELGY